VITISGSGLCKPGATLKFDHVEQELLTCEDSEITFGVTKMNKRNTKDIELYFDEGFPAGVDQHILDRQLWLWESIAHVSPAEGSAGGTRLTLTGTAFGVETPSKGLKLQAKINQKWTKISDYCTIVENGVMTCVTLPMDVPSSPIRVVNTDRKWAAVKVPGGVNFRYKQRGPGEMTPEVSSAVIEGTPANKIRFTGIGFVNRVAEGASATGYFRGHVATEVSRTNAEVVVAFTHGVPLLFEDDDAVPKLAFTGEDDYEIFALQTGVEMTRPDALTIHEENGVQCSFAGGCEYSIVAEGLTSALINTSGSSIEVCGNVCELDATRSNEGRATCMLPPLATRYSVEEFSIAETAVF